ncbi:hypothetical protein MAR_019060 [Mya arenaria]|uniref:Fibronectin type-III domain-containing protein n=1 Tax=Mya arenaria TaxID=6604 RepID=A0ABY7EJJ3_MYAAR|nr:hypothetical protein MAR_019060 [Mya arenaria]
MWFIVGLLSALRVFSTQGLSEIAGSDSIVIHWNGSEIPGYSEDIQGYSISCQLRSDRKGKHVVVNRKYFTFPSDSKMATISGLYPGTAYHIGIAAFNKTGYTPSVIVLTVNTLPEYKYGNKPSRKEYVTKDRKESQGKKRRASERENFAAT